MEEVDLMNKKIICNLPLRQCIRRSSVNLSGIYMSSMLRLFKFLAENFCSNLK